jgi:hypothetical protein
MPTNFNQAFSAPGTPDVTYQASHEGFGDLWTQAAGGIAETGKILGEKRDERELNKALDEMQGIENQGTEFYDARQELFNQMQTADAEQLNVLHDKLYRLKAGEEQGILSPTESKLRIDKLVKDYSVKLPHLGGQFRSMGSAAQGNLAAVAREYGGEDPIDKAVRETLYDAQKLGTTPEVVTAMRMSEELAKMTKAQMEVSVATQSVGKNNFISGYANVSMLQANTVVTDLRKKFTDLMTKGETVTDENIDSFIEHYRGVYGGNILSDALALAAKSGIALDKEAQESILAPMNRQLDILSKALKNEDTLQNKVKYLENTIKLIDAKGAIGPLQDNSLEATYLRSIPSKGREAFLGMKSAATWRKARLQAQGMKPEDIEATLMEWANSRMAQPNPNAPYEVQAIQMVIDGSYDPYIGDASIRHLEGDSLGGDSVPQAAKSATKMLTYHTYVQLPQDQRLTYTASYAGAFQWDTLISKKQLVADIRYNGGQSLNTAMEAAGADALRDLVGEVEIDLTKQVNPISYVGGVNPADPNSSKILNLNRTLKEVAENFGPDAAQLFVDKLYAHGVSNGTGVRTVFGGKKKVASPSKGNEVMSMIYDLNDKHGFGLPTAVLDGFAGQESSMGTNYAKDAGAGARGPLQITEPTFNAINAQAFNGELSFNKEEHQVLASLALLKSLFVQYGGDIKKMAMVYYSGTTNPNRRPKPGVPGPSAGQYAEQVLKRVNDSASG